MVLPVENHQLQALRTRQSSRQVQSGETAADDDDLCHWAKVTYNVPEMNNGA